MKIKRKKVSMQIFDHIKKMIEDEELQPGDRLPTEGYFTELFGVSRTPIREALSVLEASGLIKSIQGGGSIIQPISAANLMEETRYEFINPLDVFYLLETRVILESEAAYFAAKRGASADIEQIQHALVQVQNVQFEEKIGHEEDIHFHKVIIKASHNPILIQTMENISSLYYKAVKYSLAKNIGWEEKSQQVLQEHENIYKAIEKKEPERAKKAMIEHLDNAKFKITQYIENDGRE